MIKIADITSTADPIDVTSIPQTFDSLIIFIFLERDATISRVPHMKFNYDGANHSTSGQDTDWNSGYYTVDSQPQVSPFWTDTGSPSVAWIEIPNYTSANRKVATSFSYQGSYSGTSSYTQQTVRKLLYTGGAITSIRFFGPYTTTSPRVKKITIYGV